MRGKVHTSHQRTRQAGITPAYAGKSTVGRNRPARYLDHPRVCGEKRALSRSCAACGGSPPRMRGKGLLFFGVCIFDGITPAYAGKSRFLPTAFHRGRDHPRVCGEKSYANRTQMGHIGSPPRMRGKEYIFLYVFHNIGITPAYAGKSRRKKPHCTKTEDHPRVCGEKLFGKVLRHRPEGSPPRMRGKAVHHKLLLHCSGITPAYAGKSGLQPIILCL